MKQHNRVFTDISIYKELLVSFFVYLLCILSVAYFEPFLHEKYFFQVKIKCLGQTPTIKEMQTNLEIWDIKLGYKKFHVKIRVFLMIL